MRDDRPKFRLPTQMLTNIILNYLDENKLGTLELDFEILIYLCLWLIIGCHSFTSTTKIKFWIV